MIDAIAVFNTSLTTDLELVSWKSISMASEAGNAASIWSVGDTKTINLNGVSYTAQIIGFNHDTKTSGGKAGITFMIRQTYSQYKPWNDSSSNANGISWVGSLIRTNCVKANEDYYTFDKTVTSTTEGTYYIWDNEVINGRIRITNSASNVGKTPVGSYVSGWVKTSDIK